MGQRLMPNARYARSGLGSVGRAKDLQHLVILICAISTRSIARICRPSSFKVDVHNHQFQSSTIHVNCVSNVGHSKEVDVIIRITEQQKERLYMKAKQGENSANEWEV